MGYRWYEARRLAPRFPFGHGGSYTTFALGVPRLSATEIARGAGVSVELSVTNTGARRGAEVVQCYVAPVAPRLVRPPKELKGFAKVWLDPGETTSVTIDLDARAFAYWDPGDPDRAALRARIAATPFEDPAATAPEPGWRVDPGRYELHVGRSSADVAHVVPVVVTA